VTEFEDLSTQVVGLDVSHLEKIFYNGLKPEMKEVIKMKESRGLPNQKVAVLRMESSAYYQMVSERGSKNVVAARTYNKSYTKPFLITSGAPGQEVQRA